MVSQPPVLKVFIASPGDVPEERKAVSEVCREITYETGRHHGWSVHADGWELTRPGLGRAQELINPLVDDCDVLVGVLHRRWGTATGEFSSGFEEELQRVRERRAAGESVDAMIYLRALDVDADTEIEPLNLEFRERVKAWAKYGPYSDVAEFRGLVKGHLTDILNERIALQRSAQQSAGEPAALSPGDPPPKALDVTAPLGATAARAALIAMADALLPDTKAPSEETITRAFLAAGAELSTHVTGSVMDVQDLIRIYDARDRFVLSDSERHYVLRTMAASPRFAPGWGLLGRDPSVRPLAAIATGDSTVHVQAGAIRELGVGGFRAAVDPGKFTLLDILEYLASSDEQDVVEEVCDLLSENPVPESALLLAILCDEDRPASYSARRALMALLASEDPDAAAQVYARSNYGTSDDFSTLLVARGHALGDMGLSALARGTPAGRALRLRILAASRRLTEADVRTGMTDPDPDVRLAAARAALAARMKLPEAELASLLDSKGRPLYIPGLDGAWLATIDTDELRRRARWGELGRFGPLAMRELLLRRDGAALAQARSDLAGDDLRDRHEETVEHHVREGMASPPARPVDPAALESSLRTAWQEVFRKYESLHDQQWRVALLQGLAADAEPSDRMLALHFLTSTDSDERTAAAALLHLTGTRDDADALMAYAGSLGADQAATFAWLAEVVRDGDVLLQMAKAHEIPPWNQAKLIDAIRTAGGKVTDDTLDGLLRHERAELRQAALRLAAGDGTRTAALGWLDRVLKDGYRYFDVVATLDRLAYAPDPVADVARRLLAKQS